MHRFNDQIVIVTGGTRGIGKAITEGFLKQGATVLATYAGNTEAAEKTKQEFDLYGDKLQLFKFDVSNATEVENFYKEIAEKNLNPHILINNGGIRRDNLVASMSTEQWQKVMDVNLGGTFLMSQKAVFCFLRNRYGRIINISSIAARMGLPGQANYTATKAAQQAFSLSLAKEVAKKGITVNNIAPGFIETELIADLPEKQVDEYKKQVPMKKFGKPEDVAQAVMFLASKEAGYITGTTIDVAGGL